MSIKGIIIRRVIFGFLTIWAVLTAVFFLFMAGRDWAWDRMEGPMRLANVPEEEIAETREWFYTDRGLDVPLYELYFEWIGNMFTFQWGTSFNTELAVAPLIARATLRTASYVIPGILLAILIGVLVGTYAAMRPETIPDRSSRSVIYFLFGLPNFWIGAIVVMATVGVGGIAFRRSTAVAPLTDLPFLLSYVLPVLLVTTTLLGGIVTGARSHGLEYATADLTKLVRAKGLGTIAVAKHVLRNAAIPLVAIAFSETLSLLVLAVFVIEVLLGIEGIGLWFYNSVWTQDLPVLLAGTMVIVAVGVIGTLIEDLSYAFLDPRIEAES